MLTEMPNDAAAEKTGSTENGNGAIVHGRRSSNSSTHAGAVSTARFRSREQHDYSPLSMTWVTSYRWGSISSAN